MWLRQQLTVLLSRVEDMAEQVWVVMNNCRSTAERESTRQVIERILLKRTQWIEHVHNILERRNNLSQRRCTQPINFQAYNYQVVNDVPSPPPGQTGVYMLKTSGNQLYVGYSPNDVAKRIRQQKQGLGAITLQISRAIRTVAVVTNLSVQEARILEDWCRYHICQKRIGPERRCLKMREAVNLLADHIQD
ncbi:MAG: hypothetical protein KVP17_003024 [Porospora cf. gigantea B]|uniref:uncharacterized protein n=1 Tax=Porospora cf. gigantea B TaxID=2853592 RepID=UPI0035718A1A|nr:MAG: hypothetical protein KVP17_003024 [Porospora cf. gigantea B]